MSDVLGPIRAALQAAIVSALFGAVPQACRAQCGPSVPTFIVDLSYSPTATYLSPPIQRQDTCCGATNPDVCIQFILTLHPLATGIIFNICSGAIPSGSMFYQLACGPPVAVGAPLCLNGAGPHVITFCKPGNNVNEYCITSLGAPEAGPNITINEGCSGIISSTGFDPANVSWTSILPGAPGTYDGYLACATCTTTTVAAQPGHPAFVDYMICGASVGACGTTPTCDTVRVFMNDPLLVSIAPVDPVICAGSSTVTLTAFPSGGAMPYSLLWSTGATSASVTVGAGTYTVTVNDASGCPGASASMQVTQQTQAAQASAGTDVVSCNGATVLLNGSTTASVGALWTGGSGTFIPGATSAIAQYTPTPAEVASGSLTLVLHTTGNAPCPESSDAVLIVFGGTSFTGSTTSTLISCAGGSNGTAAFTPNDPSFDYLWDDPAGQTTATATGLDAGTYSVTVTDALGCDTVMSVQVNEPSQLAITGLGTIDATCNGASNGSASITVNGGTPGYTYTWSPNAAGQNSASISNLTAGLYSVTVADANGCSVNANLVVGQPQPIALLPQIPDTACVNAPVQLIAQASGGTAPYSIGWAGMGFGDTITWAFPSSQTVSVTVVDANGCTGPTVTGSVMVLDINTASFSAYGDTTVCPGGLATIGALFSGYPGPAQITWPSISMAGAGPFVIGVPATQLIQAIVTDVCGNTLQDQVLLQLEIPPAIALPPVIAEGCDPMEVTFPDPNAGPGMTYLWDLGDGTMSVSATPTHTYAPGSYSISLTVTSPAGCTSTSNTGAVIVHPSPVAAFDASPWTTDMDAPTIAFTDQSSGTINDFDWAFGDGSNSMDQNPDHTYSAPSIYAVTLTVTDINGCTSEVTQPVTVTPIYDVTLPNVFTPDPNGGNGGMWDPGDLSNNVFYPFVDFIEDIRMRIFNRWGELVFESRDINVGWDGYYRGQLSPQDVYAVQLWVRFVDGKEAEYLTDLTLMR